MNKTILVLSCIFVIIVGIFVAFILYKPQKEEQVEEIFREVAEQEIIDECTEEYEQIQNEMLEANSQEEKASPNCSFTIKKEYQKCGHTTSEYSNLPQELVNSTKKEIQEKYADFEIEKFSENDMVLIKKEDGECGEHFVLRNKDGVVVVYRILEDGTEIEFEATEIATEYLTLTDRNNMENGIRVNGKQELNRLLEDFE